MIHYIDGDLFRDVYLVGDIHGQKDRLIRQLDSLGFDYNQDLLVAVGDLVDRGKQGYETAKLIEEDWFVSVRGNHDHYCIQGFNDIRYEISHMAANNGGAWFYLQDREKQIELVRLFDTLPYLIEIKRAGKKYGVVHADLPELDWDIVKQLLLDDAMVYGRNIKHHLTWARGLVYMQDYHIKNIDHVFIGHTVVDEKLTIGNVSFIDTGSVYFNTDLYIVKLE